MILFVDDEARWVDSLVRELTEKYEVSFYRDVDSAWQCFEEFPDDIELLILDIMMPPGNVFKEFDTDEGRRTGIFFYEKVRDREPWLPVIILTNVSDEEVIHRFRTEKNCWLFEKTDYLPYQIVQEVDQILTPPEIHTQVQ